MNLERCPCFLEWVGSVPEGTRERLSHLVLVKSGVISRCYESQTPASLASLTSHWTPPVTSGREREGEQTHGEPGTPNPGGLESKLLLFLLFLLSPTNTSAFKPFYNNCTIL